MGVQIIFEVNTDALSAGGTFANPTSTGHPAMTIIVGDAAPASQPSNYQVPIHQNSEVMIWCEDSGRRANIAMAPVRFLAHFWAPGPPHSRSHTLTVGEMNAPDPPISQVSFAQEHANLHAFGYSGGDSTPSWGESSSPFWSGVYASDDVEILNPRVFHPYMSFNTHDNEGLLTYGLEFAVLKNGQLFGYYYFDPAIRILNA